MTKTKPKIEFKPTEMKSNLFWSVQVIFQDVPPLQLGGFKTEEEAKDWIARKSDAWLKGYASGKYAKDA